MPSNANRPSEKFQTALVISKHSWVMTQPMILNIGFVEFSTQPTLAVRERDVRFSDPNRIKPVIADPTKATNQFGIRPQVLKDLENKIHKGSGKNGN